MRDVFGWCEWLGVETRVVDLTEDGDNCHEYIACGPQDGV
jgi:hypothetical protein